MNNEYLQNWIIKAENDLKVAEHESRVDKADRVTEAICFHCQQAVEKYLKAYLIFLNIDFGKTHNLEYLIELCARYDEKFHTIDVGNLSFFAVEVRYPDDFYIPTIQEAEDSVGIAKNVREFVFVRIKKEKQND